MPGPKSWKARTIASSKEIREILRTGRKFGNPWYKVLVRKGFLTKSRFVVLVGKRLGNAVCRNRIKRRLREILRVDRALQSLKADVVIVPQPAIIDKEYSVISDKIHNTFLEINP